MRWAAQCGITPNTVLLLEDVARSYRNEQLGWPLNSVEPWPNELKMLLDVDRAPPEAEMTPMPFPSVLEPVEEPDAMQMDDKLAAVAGSAEPAEPTDVTMHDSEALLGNSPDEPATDGSVLPTVAPPAGPPDTTDK